MKKVITISVIALLSILAICFYKDIYNVGSPFINSLFAGNVSVHNEKEAIDRFIQVIKINDPENTSCKFDNETGYYMVSWANPGGGTGGSWYVNPINGDVLDFFTKKKL